MKRIIQHLAYLHYNDCFDQSVDVSFYYLVYHVGNSCRVQAVKKSYSAILYEYSQYHDLFPDRVYNIVRVNCIVDQLPIF